jgi:hypothetical protein
MNPRCTFRPVCDDLPERRRHLPRLRLWLSMSIRIFFSEACIVREAWPAMCSPFSCCCLCFSSRSEARRGEEFGRKQRRLQRTPNGFCGLGNRKNLANPAVSPEQVSATFNRVAPVVLVVLFAIGVALLDLIEYHAEQILTLELCCCSLRNLRCC